MSRGHRFSEADIHCLLVIIEEILPIGSNDCDRVTQHHCAYYPGYSQMHNRLKHTFLLCITIRHLLLITVFLLTCKTPSKFGNDQGGVMSEMSWVCSSSLPMEEKNAASGMKMQKTS
jgi:hypothetical protein